MLAGVIHHHEVPRLISFDVNDVHGVGCHRDPVPDGLDASRSTLQPSLALGITEEDPPGVKSDGQVCPRLKQRMHTHGTSDHLQTEPRVRYGAQRTENKGTWCIKPRGHGHFKDQYFHRGITRERLNIGVWFAGRMNPDGLRTEAQILYETVAYLRRGPTLGCCLHQQQRRYSQTICSKLLF